MDRDAIEAEVRDLLGRGEKIEAIKRYRERTGAGLAEAAEAVTAIGRGERPDSPFLLSDPDDLLELLRQGRKIEAIKRYRERTGAGLKQAKDRAGPVARIVRPEDLPGGEDIVEDEENPTPPPEME